MTVLKAQIGALESVMKTVVNELMPELLTVQGVGVVHAATLLAEAGDVRRFCSPLPCSLAVAGRALLGRTSQKTAQPRGNRRLNRTFHVTGALAPP